MAEAAALTRGPGFPGRPGTGADLDPAATGDLLFLASLAWEAPWVVLAVARPDGDWAVHAGGESHQAVLDRRLVEQLVATDGPVEYRDLLSALPDSPYARFPYSMRWGYGSAIRDGAGRVVAVLLVLDRWLRSATQRDHRVMQLMARRVLGYVAPAPMGRTRPSAPTAIKPCTASPPASVIPLPEPARRPLGNAPAPDDLHPRFLRSSDVAALFDVTERTVINWAASGKVKSIRTVGGHLRFREEDILAMVGGLPVAGA